jgi:hypothetical protein
MKARHAAALALIGWYLMAPPLIKGGHDTYTVYRSAPLSEWIFEESFDSAVQCRQGILDNISGNRNAAVLAGECAATPGTPCNTPLLDSAVLAKCIASDDPRLKEK